MSWLRQALCATVGHLWECWWLKDGRVLGWQCAHCDKFSKTRPGGLLSKYLE